MKENFADEQANMFSQLMNQSSSRTRQNTMGPGSINQSNRLFLQSKEDRIIEREMKINIDQTEDNIRPRTPPNIKLQEFDQPDLFTDGSNERFTEKFLQIKQMQPGGGNNSRRMTGNKSNQNSRRKSGMTFQSYQ